jgi:hypothetical protein
MTTIHTIKEVVNANQEGNENFALTTPLSASVLLIKA